MKDAAGEGRSIPRMVGESSPIREIPYKEFLFLIFYYIILNIKTKEFHSQKIIIVL